MIEINCKNIAGFDRDCDQHRISASGLAFCLALICFAATPLAAQEDSAEARRACTPDVFRLCSAFVPDAERITLCLQQQKKNLSPGCRRVMAGQPVSR